MEPDQDNNTSATERVGADDGAPVENPQPSPDVEQRAAEKTRRSRRLRKRLPTRWTDWLALAFNGLLVLSTFLLWDATRKLWLDAHDQLGVVRGQLNTMLADQRPWIKIDSFGPKSVRIVDKNVNIEFVLRLVNIGKTPALGVDLRVKSYVESDDVFRNWETLEAEVCEPARKIWPSRVSRNSLMPNEIIVQNIGTPLSTVDVLNAIEGGNKGRMIKIPPNKAAFEVIGCVDYLFGSDNQHGQTFFVFSLAKRGPNNLPYLFDIPFDGTLFAGQLLMSKMPSGNHVN